MTDIQQNLFSSTQSLNETPRPDALEQQSSVIKKLKQFNFKNFQIDLDEQDDFLKIVVTNNDTFLVYSKNLRQDELVSLSNHYIKDFKTFEEYIQFAIKSPSKTNYLEIDENFNFQFNFTIYGPNKKEVPQKLSFQLEQQEANQVERLEKTIESLRKRVSQLENDQPCCKKLKKKFKSLDKKSKIIIFIIVGILISSFIGIKIHHKHHWKKHHHHEKWGNQGKQGRQGTEGFQGPKGPAGPEGKSAPPLTVNYAYCSSGTQGKHQNSCVADCPKNFKVIGGGCECTGWQNIWRSKPNSDNQWLCACQEDNGSNSFFKEVKGYAVCAKQ